MVFVLCGINIAALILFWFKFRERSLKRIYFTIFFSCYVFTYFGGIVLASVLFSVLGIEKISTSDETTWKLVVLADASLISFLFGYWVAAPLRRFVKKGGFIEWDKRTSALTFVLVVAFVVSMLVYVVGSGGPVLFKAGGYQNRYDANIGMGGYSLFFSMGLVACTLLSLRSAKKREKRVAVFYTALYCALTFIVLGGYRQLGFAALFSSGVILLLRRDITFRGFMWLSGGLILMTLLVAIFRYTGTDADDNGGLAGRLFIFLYDGFTPVDAFYNIISFCRNSDVGVNVFWNQFLTAVPRWVWSEKPLIVLNAGNFYTQNILGRTDSITYSPTLLGELYLIGGVTGCLVGTFVSGVLLRIFDEIILRSGNRILVAFTFSFGFVFVFNLYREGLGVLITKVVLYGAALITMKFLSELIFHGSARTRLRV
jgi:enterobacterial common antigen polymerase